MLEMQRRNVIELEDSSDEDNNKKAVKSLHRKLSLFGTLGQIRTDIDYYLKKP